MLTKQFILLLLLLFFVAPDLSADLQNSRTQLKQIQQRIENAQIDLQQKKKSEIRFSRELALLRETLRQLDGRISAIKKEQRQVQEEIDSQRQQIAAGEKQIRQIGKRLEKRLVALYKEGEIGPLKILFSADSPTELVQQYHYLTLVVEYDRELLGEFRSAVEANQRRLESLEKLDQQKSALLQREEQQRKVAADGRRLQARLLKQVKDEKQRLNRELVQLNEQAKRLQELIVRLQEQSVDPAPVTPGADSFSGERNTLNWPVAGEVLIGYGTQKDKSLGTYYESNGLEIAVQPGTNIRAVADGKVVFADWFKGYGNLLIVSHPGGFHTLYAQAEQLNKVPGQLVRAGEVVGKSGLGGRDSLYFEIRKNGAPVNPLKWLQRR